MTTINPYLTFGGNCEQAFNYYKSVFGGDFQYLGRFSEMPENEENPIPEEDKNKIMHVSLPIGGATLMGSDSSSQFGPPIVQGNNFSISIDTTDIEETDRIFKALAEGGQEIMAPNKTFWGSYFGMCKDQFGISWMVNCKL